MQASSGTLGEQAGGGENHDVSRYNAWPLSARALTCPNFSTGARRLVQRRRDVFFDRPSSASLPWPSIALIPLKMLSRNLSRAVLSAPTVSSAPARLLRHRAPRLAAPAVGRTFASTSRRQNEAPKSPFQTFVDVLRDEIRKNRELQDNVKQLQGDVDKLQDSEAMKRARDAYERARVSP